MNDILRIRDDFSERHTVQYAEYEWVASQQLGVDRMMLDRIGNEVARATSIVRYQPNSNFPAHVHDGGEEFLVLDGVFSDEYNDYPEGVYVRNPIGTRHTPKVGTEGAVIFVKLHQFSPQDQKQTNINTNNLNWIESTTKGVSVKPLHEFENEKVALIKIQKHNQYSAAQYAGGAEILVLDGTLYDDQASYPKGAWLRYPHHCPLSLFTKGESAKIFIKTGHLPT